MFKSIDQTVLKASLTTILGCLVIWLTGLAHAGDSDTASNDALRALGRLPTTDEIAAWDIDVRPDFKGLPPGRGSAKDGLKLWEGKCASCHGVFGESNEVFTPLVGGTTKDDVKQGTVAALSDGSHPHRTTFMRLSQMSTLWDYINRAMPWTQPKSLKPDQTYAVIAYLLHLADLAPADFVLSDQNIAQVQASLPNRNGMNKYSPLWEVNGKPDVQGDSCMRNCQTQLDIKSFIPEYARNAHGNLAEQNRGFGPTRGVDTTRPPPDSLSDARTMAANQGYFERQSLPAAEMATPADDQEALNQGTAAVLAKESGCLACHGLNNKILGPGFNQIAARYKKQDGATALLTERVRSGAQGTWGQIPMPANGMVSKEQASILVTWILAM